CKWRADGRLEAIQDGLFFADDLQKRYSTGFLELRHYAREHDYMLMTAERFAKKLNHPRIWCSRADFVRFIFYVLAYDARALVSGFNLPFDLSRIAVDWGTARGAGANTFSLVLAKYADGNGKVREHHWHPRIHVQHV